MRYRFAVLLLFAMLPMMNLLAAPAPEPSAVLDIEPPPKWERADVYYKQRIEGLTCHGILSMVWSDPEVKKLPSVSRFKDPRPWLEKYLQTKQEDGERRLRLTFRAGNRTERVTILNALLRFYLRQCRDEGIKFHEECLRQYENDLLQCEKRIESAQPHESVDSERRLINELRSNRIPVHRAEIARYKQIAVINWAR